MEYKFKNSNLLQLALTHSSFANEKKLKHTDNNERLEFLGDSVLSIVVSEYLYVNFPDIAEGELTKMRASVVCEGALSVLAKAIHLGDRLNLGRGEEFSGGRDRESILADAFEAVLGAIYLDGGMGNAKKWLLNLIVPLIDEAKNNNLNNDFKTALQEYSQKGTKGKITYETISEEGPDHNKLFTVCVLMDGESLKQGTGHSKKEAEQMAAKDALDMLKEQ